MVPISKPSRLNMNVIKKNIKSLINSKETWKNVEKPKFDSMEKSSKFMVNV